ncbi:salivary anticoagulant protein P23-like [Dermacentor variabilis]|uniref:salivary anticoagulant protein P23-like n=1 Tax=Dermacentor variabilis TaxID=34621 RepID=UPI003F5B4ABA
MRQCIGDRLQAWTDSAVAAIKKNTMKTFVVVLFIVIHFGNAEVSDEDDCTEAQQRAMNGRSLSSRRFMWWPFDACKDGFTRVTCEGDLECHALRLQSTGFDVSSRTLWTHTRGTDSVSKANDFVDTVLLQRMPTLVRRYQGSFSLAPYYFKVYKTSWTNRDLKVYVNSGQFRNFDTSVRRVGDCVLAMVAGNVSLSCALSIGGIAAELHTETKGDGLLGIIKSVRVEALQYQTTGKVEVTAALNQPAFVRTLIVDNAGFEVTPGHNLELNSIRMRNFKSRMGAYLMEQMREKFYSNYEAILRHAFSRNSFFLF